MKAETVAVLYALILSSAWVGGCASGNLLPGRNVGKATSFESGHPARDATQLLGYFRHLHTLPRDKLNQEYAAANRVAAMQKTDAGRLQLALLLSVPNAEFRDDERAIQLVQQSLDDPSGDPLLKDLAFFLKTALNEQRKQRLSLEQEQKRAKALQDKLEALTTIEKNLINRKQAP